MTNQILPQPEWKDGSGRDIVVGCYIAYAANVGRRPMFKFGLVTALLSKKDTKTTIVQPYQPQTAIQPYVPAQYQRVDYLRPKVRAITSSGDRIQKGGSGQVLESLNRMLVLSEDQIPPATLKALKDIWQGKVDNE